MKNIYFIYMHVKPTTGEPFYIGKGKPYLRSRCRSVETHNRSLWWKRTVDKYGFDVFFLELNLTEEEANEREKYWIKRIGRRDKGLGPLVNLTDGGEGASGRNHKHTEQTKLKLSEMFSGEKNPNFGTVGHWKNKTGKDAPASKKINQIDINGNIIKTYDSISQAVGETGILRSSISNNIIGLSKYTIHKETKNKYKWQLNYSD